MTITRESDYAIRMMLFLAEQRGRVDAKYISEQTGVTIRFALKILRQLVGAGLVKSFKGTKGGYEINRSPAEISLREILEIFEGQFILNKCQGEHYNCSHGDHTKCRLKKVFDELSSDIRARLDSVTLKDLL